MKSLLLGVTHQLYTSKKKLWNSISIWLLIFDTYLAKVFREKQAKHYDANKMYIHAIQ